MTIRLPPVKAERVRLACQSLLDKSKMTIREVAQVIGLMVSSFPAVQFGELYYRALERNKILALQEIKVGAIVMHQYIFQMNLDQR